MSTTRLIVWVTLVWMAGSACATSRAATPGASTSAAPPIAAAAPTAASPSPGATPPPMRREIRWVRTSAEYRALALQVYRDAASRLREQSKALGPGSWGVILDADETVFDNSEYQLRRAAVDSGYTTTSWAKWANERAAGAVPGAVEFTQTVHALNGRVAIVTNRAESLCGATRDNLRQLGILPDILLCQPPGENDKNPRFQRIQSGAAVAGMPPLAILEWIGDNILDFPGMSQASRSDSTAMASFGQKFFVVPNPMYGSWEPRR